MAEKKIGDVRKAPKPSSKSGVKAFFSKAKENVLKLTSKPDRKVPDSYLPPQANAPTVVRASKANSSHKEVETESSSSHEARFGPASTATSTSGGKSYEKDLHPAPIASEPSIVVQSTTAYPRTAPLGMSSGHPHYLHTVTQTTAAVTPGVASNRAVNNTGAGVENDVAAELQSQIDSAGGLQIKENDRNHREVLVKALAEGNCYLDAEKVGKGGVKLRRGEPSKTTPAAVEMLLSRYWQLANNPEDLVDSFYLEVKKKVVESGYDLGLLSFALSIHDLEDRHDRFLAEAPRVAPKPVASSPAQSAKVAAPGPAKVAANLPARVKFPFGEMDEGVSPERVIFGGGDYGGWFQFRALLATNEYRVEGLSNSGVSLDRGNGSTDISTLGRILQFYINSVPREVSDDMKMDDESFILGARKALAGHQIDSSLIAALLGFIDQEDRVDLLAQLVQSRRT